MIGPGDKPSDSAAARESQKAGLSPERVRALNAWAASLTPQEATRVRALVRCCGCCVHFEPVEERERACYGICCAGGPSTFLPAPPSGTIAIATFPSPRTVWPEVTSDRRCGRWNHPSLPLNYLSGLSPVELDQVASAMGVQIDG